MNIGRWTIPNNHELLANRKGGERAQEGFAFQRAYGIYLLLDLLEELNGLGRLRWEGVEDIDLCYPDRCLFIQVKHGNVDKKTILEVLKRFYEVWETVSGKHQFCLVYPIRLRVRCPEPWPKYVTKLYSKMFLSTVELRPVQDTEQLLNASSVRLARRGIPSFQLNNALSELFQLLPEMTNEVLVNDVREALSKFRQQLPLTESAHLLSLRGIKRISNRLGQFGDNCQYVQRWRPPIFSIPSSC